MSGLLKLTTNLTAAAGVIAGAYYLIQQDSEFKKTVNPMIRETYDRLSNSKTQYRKAAMINTLTESFFDIDAGTGLNVRYVNPRVDTYTAVVRTKEEAELVHEEAIKANRPVHAVITRAPLTFLKSLPDKSIESFLITDAFSKMNEEEFREALENVYRVLKTGGKMYFSDYTLHPYVCVSSVKR